jgi:hypothetical protein
MNSKLGAHFYLRGVLSFIAFFASTYISFGQIDSLSTLDSSKKAIYIPEVLKNNLDSIEQAKSPFTLKRTFYPDIILLNNGDRITGKIISFEQGRLKIDAQGPGVVSIKWYKIKTMGGGSRIFEVEDIDGDIYFGELTFSNRILEFNIYGDSILGISLDHVSKIFPLEEKWYRGLKGNLGGGLSYTKSDNVFRLNAEYNIYYVLSKWRFINELSYISTTINKADPSVRSDLNFQAQYTLPNKWLLYGLNVNSKNDELGIDSRISFGTGGGNSIVQTENQRLILLSGILTNFEKDVDETNTKTNIEWPFTIQHVIFNFENPNLSINTSLSSFVGLTEKSRLRFDGSTDITWEFINNFKLQLSLYYNFDNKDIETKSSSKDYGTVISLLLELK